MAIVYLLRMSKEFAKNMIEERQTSAVTFSSLPIPQTTTSSTPIPIPPPDKLDTPHSEMPFMSLISTSHPRTILGDIGLRPHTYHFASNPLTPEQVRKLPPKDQMWDFGYVLDPEMSGKGVMSELVGVVIEGWVRPYMGLGRVGAVSLLVMG
jgi:hypothetical protein